MLHMKSVMKIVSQSSPTLGHPVPGHENIQKLQLALQFSGTDLEFLERLTDDWRRVAKQSFIFYVPLKHLFQLHNF